jgi:hypothetical protein
VEDAFHYYRTFYNAPPGIKVRNVAPRGILVLLCRIRDAHVHGQALLHGLMGIGVVAIIAKLHRWNESAVFFDGGSLGECILHPSHHAVFGVHTLVELNGIPAVKQRRLFLLSQCTSR